MRSSEKESKVYEGTEQMMRTSTQRGVKETICCATAPLNVGVKKTVSIVALLSVGFKETMSHPSQYS
jgi:hypothetical protein